MYVVFCLPPLIAVEQWNLFNYAVICSVIECKIVMDISGLLTENHKPNSEDAQPSTTSEIWKP
jgi:hypothetical protein